ncbi:hypothetical protein HNR42_000621 [Deinobacterium chartae]|uniref:Heat induced stress protein YflT n=1 Tax=Deinobacterium chartae TaxID=521158 RepID=A0A841HV04_9DEIO|nr:hypothetical protein [Deinobacterium chartae]MBB6097207.1 hypothetical protein [Deinobacterium chartae]
MRVTAVFDSRTQAEAAVSELRRMGVADSQLSYISKHDDNLRATDEHYSGSTHTAQPGMGSSMGSNMGSNLRDDVRTEPHRDAEGDMVRSDGVTGKDMGEGAAKGLLVGGSVGAIFGLAAALIPGVGPIITAGALATSLGSAAGGAVAGAIVGGTAGTIAGALSQAGYSGEEATYYGEAVERGGFLVAVDTTPALGMNEVQEVLRRHGGRMYSA